MARATQLCLALENRPGQLAKVTGALARAKVNINAISVADTVDCCLIRMVVDAPGKAKKVLQKAKVAFWQQPVLVVKMPNKPGQLAGVARKLAAAGVNLEYVYGSTAGTGKDSTVVLRVDNITKAQRKLKA